MAKQELFERSPIRAFDAVANGGLKAGELGLVTAKKGVGKTAVLVQFGMDTLLNGKQLVHVSFDQVSANVITWYDTILGEISKNKTMSDDVKDQVLRNRTILNFNQDNVSLEKVINTLNALKAGGIGVAGVVIDGTDFGKVKESDIQARAAVVKAREAFELSRRAAHALSEAAEELTPPALRSSLSLMPFSIISEFTSPIMR